MRVPVSTIQALKGAGRALSLKMHTSAFTGALHEGECSGGSACAEGGRWSVGNAATGRSRAWRAWCCVEWRERREERSKVTGASDGIKRRHCAGFAIALCRSDCPKPHPRTQRKRRTQRPERNTATTARHSTQGPKAKRLERNCLPVATPAVAVKPQKTLTRETSTLTSARPAGIVGGQDTKALFERDSVSNYERIFSYYSDFFSFTPHGEKVLIISSIGISLRFINKCNRCVDSRSHPEPGKSTNGS